MTANGMRAAVSRLAASFVLLLVAAWPASSSADDGDFYKSKTIQIVIGYGTGGGYDLYARLMARYLGNFIPGNPKVVIVNMPGAASRTAAAYLANIAPRDGTIIGVIDPGLSLAQAMGEPLLFDNTKFNWLGNVDQDPTLLLTWYTTGVTDIEQARRKVLQTGGIQGSSSAQIPLLMNALLGTKFKLVVGYTNGTDVNLAMERGELDARGSAAWSAIKSDKPDWLRDHKVNILTQVGLKKAADLPNVPLLIDLAGNDEDRAVLRLYSASITLGRPILATPGLPDDQLKLLRNAFDSLVKDAAFLQEAKAENVNVSPVSGKDVQSLVSEIVTAPSSVTQRLASIINVTN